LTKYNIALIATFSQLRDAFWRMHREVIETIQWGLATLGHDVTTTTDEFARDRTNISIGTQMLPIEAIDTVPPGTIIYNLEQLGGLLVSQLKPILPALAKRFQIWDFSVRNMPTWAATRPTKPVLHVPIGWAPVLERIPSEAVQDIDVLFYGGLSPERAEVLNALGLAGTVFAINIFGQARDSLIARSRIVLNINRHASRIFEIVRVSYLLANAKAVVADIDGDTFIEPDIRDAIASARLRKVATLCQELLADDSRRKELERRGQQIFRKRSIETILARAFSAMGQT
jgi:hypothetical protein